MVKPKGETDNCRNRLLKYCNGQGLDLGCGNVKIKVDAIGIDLLNPSADMAIDARLMPCYPDSHFDYIYSSHLLEEIQNTEATLREWLRILKDDGYLILYQVDKEYYHPLGDPRCNKKHLHHFSWEKLWEIFQKIGGLELIHHARYNIKMYGEWSFEIVVQKKGKKKIVPQVTVKSEYKEEKNTLRIVTPCWNAGAYVIRCIKSIKNQSVQNWKCYLCNDLSTDDTLEFIKKHTEGDDRFVIINNTKKRFVSGNYFHTLHRQEINDQDICINIDGDDWLPEDDKVFERIIEAYKDPDTWITFGQFREYSGRGERSGWARMPKWELLRKTTDWRATHLRTFKTWLFRKINLKDFLISEDTFWPMAGDLSFMIPMLEMAGPEHSKLLNSVNYIYNTESDINEHKRGDTQKKSALEIFQRPPYKRLKDMNVIIFSKDRACQLDLLLRSIKELWENWHEFKINIIWTYSNDGFKRGYEKVIQEHPEISFSKQEDFKQSVINVTNTQKEYTMFLVDDIVFKEPFKLRADFEKLIPEDVLSISLRLCQRISHCYPLNIPTPSPDLSSENKWKWQSHIGDWGYPMSVDGNIYRTSDLIEVITNGTYNNPNTFEDALRTNIPARPLMLCYDESKIINIPLNLVGQYPNRHGRTSAKQLNEKYLEGNKLSLNDIKGFKNISPHQEVELKWED